MTSSHQPDASTEQILAAIRDIMGAEGPESARGPARDTHAQKTPGGVLELTQVVDTPPSEVVQLLENQIVSNDREAPLSPPPGLARTAASAASKARAEAAARPAPRGAERPLERPRAASSAAPKASRSPAAAEAKRREDRVISDRTASQAAASLAHLIQAKVQHQVSQSLTVEELVLEAVRPLLGAWLDVHLPEIVERTVEFEIKKLLANLRP